MARKRSKKPNLTPAKCRDCVALQKVIGYEWIRAAAPRCSACGGMLDRLKFRRSKRKPKVDRSKCGPTNKPLEQSTRLGNRTGSASQDRTRQRPGTDVKQPGRMEPKSAQAQPQSNLLMAGTPVERPTAP